MLGYWKRCAAWATAYVRKYQTDPTFKTELNVAFLQAVLTICVLCITLIALTLLYERVLTEILSNLSRVATSESPTNLSHDLEAIRERSLVILALFLTACTVFFGFLIHRLALSPARNALAAQKQFIGNIAHELRTPLAVIKTNTEVALLETDISPEVRSTLMTTTDELDRISNIINNLLTLNTLIRPGMISLSHTELGPIIERVLGHLAPLIEKKATVVTLSQSPHSAVWANETALEQILTNIIKNAVTYTRRGGRVAISFEPDHNGYILIQVSDTGLGIDPQDLKHIFAPFFRADRSRARASGGSGLGLAIVNELVKLHHGRIVVRSRPNVGTSVFLYMPCARQEDVPEDKDTPMSEVAVNYSGGGLHFRPRPPHSREHFTKRTARS